MSTLTKIFIVLMVVFSIAFAMTTINFVAKSTQWKSLAETYGDEVRVVETHMRNQAAAQAAEKTAWLDTRNDLDQRIADLQQTNSRQLVDIADFRDQIAKLESEKTSSESLASRMASELQVAHNGWLEQQKEREALEQRNMELERRNQDLDGRIHEQTAQILALVQQQKQLEQQVNILQQEQKKMNAGEDTQQARMAAPVDHGVTPVSGGSATPIRGRIIEIQGKVATVSVGSADGVQEGLVFVIYRGNEYVGDLKITDVEPNIAAGRIIRARSDPRPNDMVADEPAFTLAP